VPQRLDRVQVDVAEEMVEISWGERDKLLARLRLLEGFEDIVSRFEAVGASHPVELDDDQQTRLRVMLELWGITLLSKELAHLLVVLVRADPGGVDALNH
jgi:hypothetical protein